MMNNKKSYIFFNLKVMYTHVLEIFSGPGAYCFTVISTEPKAERFSLFIKIIVID